MGPAAAAEPPAAVEPPGAVDAAVEPPGAWVAPPPVQAANNMTVAVARAMVRPADLSFKIGPPILWLPHHGEPSRPAEAVLHGLDRWPTWPGERSWG